MTEPDKSGALNDKRDERNAKSDLPPTMASTYLQYAPPETGSSDTVEEPQPSDKVPDSMVPVGPLSEEEYSEGHWLKWEHADMRNRVLMETAKQKPPEATRPPGHPPMWICERLCSIDNQVLPTSDFSTTTEDRPSSDGSRRISGAGPLPVAPVVVKANPPPAPVPPEPTGDTQSYHSVTAEPRPPDMNVPSVNQDEGGARAKQNKPRSLAIYDTETAPLKHPRYTGTSTGEDSVDVDYLKDELSPVETEAPGELPDESPPKVTSLTPSSMMDLTTPPFPGEYRPAGEPRPPPLLPASSSATRLMAASADKSDGWSLTRERDWHSTIAALRMQIPSCLLLVNLVVALILVLVAHLYTLYSVLNEPLTASPNTTALERPDRPVCQGVHCSGTGTHIFYTLNQSADPCQSPFDLVCRPWVRQTPANYRRIIMGRERVFVDHTLLEIDKLLRSHHLASRESMTSSAKLVLLYNRCMDGNLRDSEGLDYFREVMWRYELHRWPYHDEDVLFGQSQRTLKRFAHETGSDPYFKVLLGKNSSRSLVLVIDCPSLGLPPMSFVNGTADVEHYIDYAKTIIQETTANTSDARRVATNIVQFETDLARLHVTHCNHREKYSQKATDELRADKWDWKEFLSFITEGAINQDIVLVRSPDYLNDVIAIIEKNSVAGANYLGWKVASRLLPYTTSRIADLTEQFFASTGLQARPTFQQCLAQVNQVLPFAMGHLYVKATKPSSTSFSAYRVAYHLTQSLDRMVQLEWWLGDGIEASYRHLRDTMRMTLGLPSWIENDTLLDARYASVRITNSYLESHMSAATATFQHTFDAATSMLGREKLLFPNDVQWTADRLTPPMYDLLDNHLYLLPAALQPPYFVEETAPALNFGGLGFLLARDLVDEVVSFRKGGWPGLEIPAEARPFNCLVNRLQDPVATSFLGTKLAYLSYQMDRGFGDDQALRGLETTSPDQLFFIAISRTLCGIVRDRDYVSVVNRRSPIGSENLVDAVLLKLPEYLDAFNCSKDRMSNDYHACFRK